MADHAANVTLDQGEDSTQHGESHIIDLATVNLRLCFDGARRGDGSASAGFALLAYPREGEPAIIYRGGRMLGKLPSAFLAEKLALEVTLFFFQRFH